MSEGGQTRRSRRKDDVEEEQVSTETESTTDEVLEDVDELLDEIDDVLEENAEEFVKNYVQKGGQ